MADGRGPRLLFIKVRGNEARRGEAKKGLLVRSAFQPEGALLLLLLHLLPHSQPPQSLSVKGGGGRGEEAHIIYLFDSALPQRIWSPAKHYLQGGRVHEGGRERVGCGSHLGH